MKKSKKKQRKKFHLNSFVITFAFATSAKYSEQVMIIFLIKQI